MRTRCTMIMLVLSLLAGGPSAQESSGTAPKPKLGVVGTAHLDTQWRWTIRNTIDEYIPNTLHDNFKLLDLYPDYVFSFEGAFRYMLAKEYYPEDYARLKQYIADGRWRVTGSWVDAVDVNIPSFESLVRHALYGNGFYKKEFGKQSYDIFMPDCFGFGYALPSIAKHCGLKSFSTQKLTWGCSVPVPFSIGEWEGVDGSSIIAGLKTGNYVAKLRGDLSRDTIWSAQIDELGRATGVYAGYIYFGTGDVGGAPDSLSVDWLQKSIQGDGPVTVVSIGADDLPSLVAEYPDGKLERYNGELVMTRHGIGCYTSQAAMKRWNRKNELLADAAERAAVTAHLLGGYSYPKETFREAWIRFLWHQFHDDLTGTSIPEAYEFSWSDELLSLNQFGGLLSSAVSAVTPALDTRGKGRSLVVYNPLAIDREDVVEVSVLFDDDKVNQARVFGPDGKEVPSQVISASSGSIRLLFLAKLPSVGYAVYDVRPADRGWDQPTHITAGESGLESFRYKVTLNANGDVSSIYDKGARRELLASPIEWQLIFNKPRQWPAWEIQYEDILAGPRGVVGGTPTIEVEESGTVRGSVKVTRKEGNSTYVTTIRLAAGGAGDRVEFINKVDWAERETLLKAAFKLNTPNETVTYDLGLGVIERGINTKEKYEVPGHQWAGMTANDGSYGVAILNDCRYGWDHPDDSTLRLSLIHTPGVFDSWNWVGDQSSQDIGTHKFNFAVVGQEGKLSSSDVSWQAARLNQPLVTWEAPQHPGRLGKSYTLLSLSTPGVMVNSVKLAEESDEIIVRLRELSGHEAKKVAVQFASKVASAREVNGQEEEIGPAMVENGTLVTSLSGFQPKAFAVRLAPSKDVGLPKLVSQPIELAYDLDGISTDADRTDGDIDGKGNTLSGDLLPAELNYHGVRFVFGPTSPGSRNVVSCNGQQIPIPAAADKRGWTDLYVLMLATGGPAEGTLVVENKVGYSARQVSLFEYTEPIGQWNNRMVNGRMVEEASEILPAYINLAPVAWAGTHRHTHDGKNDTYKFTYLFAERVQLKPDAKGIVLPKNPNIKLLAASVAGGQHDRLEETAALYDIAFSRFARIAVEQPIFIESTLAQMSSPMPGAEVRYTLDGSEPTGDSPVFSEPIRLSETTTIKARAFYQQKFGGTTTSVTVKKLVPIAATPAAGVVPGLQCSYYEGEWQKLPDFDALKPVQEITMDTVAIPSVARPEDYGLVFKGYVRVPADGLYDFGVSSDDGSALWVADTLIADNDGIHGDGEVAGKIALKAGLHPIIVRMFQCKGGQALSMYITGPGIAKQTIGKDLLFHMPPPELGRRN